MQKNSPLLPGSIECALELLDVVNDAESPLSVGMLECVDVRRDARSDRRLDSRREIEQRLGGFLRQVLRNVEESVLSCRANLGDPFGRDAVRQEHPLRQI